MQNPELKRLKSPPYKGDSGVWLTEALFYQKTFDRPKHRLICAPVFDLYDERPGLINCRTTFVNLKDPTGRKWALTYLGDWNHWLRLMKCAWFREAFEIWISELNLQLKSEAIAKAICAAGGPNWFYHRLPVNVSLPTETCTLDGVRFPQSEASVFYERSGRRQQFVCPLTDEVCKQQESIKRSDLEALYHRIKTLAAP